jgi:hypothetical protein
MSVPRCCRRHGGTEHACLRVSRGPSRDVQWCSQYNTGDLEMRLTTIVLAVFAALALGGCDLIGGIFKAGMWVGMIAVIAVIVLIVFLISRFRR